ncbi:MAG: glycosyltransferase, partial [Gammaproteobacteria bacterium]|nr:glycosyltransferase [Gammaproteobacteria bacterium]
KKIDALSQTVNDRDGQISTLDKTVVKRDKKIDALSQTVNDRDGQISTLTEETIQRGEWALRLDGELKEIKMKLNMVTKSNSWRLTMPLREVRRWIDNPVQQTKRYAKGGLRALKLGYQSLPLSYQTKVSHRHLIARLFPRILLLSGSSRASIPSIINPPIVDNDELLVDVEVIDAIIKLETSTSPIVSVVIPVYGQVEYTIKCLKSIQNNLPKIPFEVILIDDCSPDNSVEILQKVKGIKLLQNMENQGFIRSCNAGADVAKGEYLCFLNNDTKVKENWLDELVRAFDEFPGTGLAGSKLVYPDGRLQEAGGIIWQDGSAWNFGRFQDPLLPIYNYAREVDYCSGASIMVPKVIFDELKGFDEHYLPAYCEDSDLALKIRDKGYRVIYQPQSTVIHYEGITSGTDTSQGAKAYQIENSKKLFTRWQERLQAHQVPGVDADNAKDRRSTRRVLAIDHCTPTPNQDAGSVTVFNLMLLLREMNFQVTFIPEDNFLYMPEYTTALQRAGIEVLYAPHVTSVEQHLKECENRYDLAFLFRPGVVERHLKSIRKHCPKVKVLFHTVDLHFLRMSREAELQTDKTKQKAADEMKQCELAAIRATDACIVHSTVELELLQPMLPDAKLHVFPLIMDIAGSNKTFADRRNIVFVGGYQHTPNVDAVHYFVTEIMPLLRKQLPGVRFYAVGSKPPADIQALASEDIIITGFVEDLTPLLDKMRISVAPLRYGAGIKGKIGTAMVVGLPVVATSLAAEGMSLNDGEDILVADGAEDVAKTITKLYQDESLWNRISKNGLMFADQAWGAEAAWEIFAAIVADLGLNVTRNTHPLTLYSERSGSETKTLTVNTLEPIASVKNRKEYEQLLQCNEITKISTVEKQLVAAANAEAFAVDGFCVPCDKKVPFLVDMKSGGQRNANGWTPNWRERLECPLCRMNNRQRLIATLIKQKLSNNKNQNVYFMEQVTPIYNWAISKFKEYNLVGSEYLGYEYEGGATIKGIRHEDVENLSFSDSQLDLIVSNNVFEHVPHPAKAFAECARVLKPGGVMLATIPFHSGMDESVIRAQLDNDQVEHLLPEAYHGNPVSADGSLVFTDFGWDILELMKVAGFSDVCVDVYISEEFGHFGGGQLVFRVRK